MKKITLIAGAITVLLAAGCGGQDTTHDQAADPHAGHNHAPGEHGKAAAPAEQAAAYPLDVCIVSGQKLGSMGDPVVLVYEGQTVKFCCQGCVGSFKKDPAKYMAKLKEAAAKETGKDPHAGHNH